MRVVSESNSPRTVIKFESEIEGLMAHGVSAQLKFACCEDEVNDMQLELDDRDGHLQQLQEDEAAMQATIAKRFGTAQTQLAPPPGPHLPIANGFNLPSGDPDKGASAATGTADESAEDWLASTIEQLKKNSSEISTPNCVYRKPPKSGV